jgi:hypothetical protein
MAVTSKEFARQSTLYKSFASRGLPHAPYKPYLSLSNCHYIKPYLSLSNCHYLLRCLPDASCWFLASLLFDPDDGGSTFLRNVGERTSD